MIFGGTVSLKYSHGAENVSRFPPTPAPPMAQYLGIIQINPGFSVWFAKERGPT